MTLFDYAVLLVVGASVLVSVMRGFVREVLSLLAWVIAFVAAALASGTVAGWLTGTIANESLRVLGAFVAVFLFTLVAMSLMAMAASGLLRKAGLGLEDRVLGGVFGLARGLLIVMVFVLLAGLTSLPRQPAWNDAMLSPPLVALAGAVKPWLPQIVSRNLSYD
ncbi:MAG TPA: CvpA family protein [Burkholderiales bacterium]|nr:CvpA family protein [Burkholderiales bacterium]